MRTALALFFLATPIFAQTTGSPCPLVNTIVVSGSGNVKIAPDRVSFTIGVATTKTSVSQAFAENSEKTRRVIATLKAKGVTESEIQTSNFSIGSPYEEGKVDSNRFVVNNNVTVTREDPKGVGELIQAAVDAGANRADSLSFYLADPTPARDRALEKAYRDARARAEKLATLAGKKLGDPVLIDTEGSRYGYDRMATQNVAMSAPVETGMVDVSGTVTVTFELR